MSLQEKIFGLKDNYEWNEEIMKIFLSKLLDAQSIAKVIKKTGKENKNCSICGEYDASEFYFKLGGTKWESGTYHIVKSHLLKPPKKLYDFIMRFRKSEYEVEKEIVVTKKMLRILTALHKTQRKNETFGIVNVISEKTFEISFFNDSEINEKYFNGSNTVLFAVQMKGKSYAPELRNISLYQMYFNDYGIKYMLIYANEGVYAIKQINDKIKKINITEPDIIQMNITFDRLRNKKKVEKHIEKEYNKFMKKINIKMKLFSAKEEIPLSTF